MDPGFIVFISVPLLIIGIGLSLFISSFQKFRAKRLVEDTPTSTIRGISMGIVEVVGKAKSLHSLKTPFTEKACVFYTYLIEEYVEDGDSRKWMTRLSGNSSMIPFLIEDGTGEILILPHGAEYILPEDYAYIINDYRSIPDNIIRFSHTFNSALNRMLSRGHTYRVREWNIVENDPLYILGYAQKISDIDTLFRNKTKSIKKKIELNPYANVYYDTDNNGSISENELQHIGTRILSDMMSRTMSGVKKGDVSDVVITSHESEEPFIISDQSQKGVEVRLKKMFINKMIAGVIMIIIGIFFIEKAINALF